MSARRLFPRSVSASLMMVYYDGAGVLPKGRRRQKKAGFPTIVIHVSAICAFLWTRWYAASRYVFPITMRLEGHLLRMSAIVWSILIRQNL